MREEYKQKRLEKILKDKADSTDMPSLEEIEAKPGYKELKTRPLVVKDESLKDQKSHESYI